MAEESSVTKTEEVAKVAVSSSPYALYGSDNPGSMITSVLLDGENYNEWSTEMLNALQAKRKTGFINGTLKKPSSDDPDFENWKTVNSMIIGWIRASIEPKVRSTVTFISDAHQLWTDLKQRFSVGNKVRVHQIKIQLASCRQDEQTVLDYYGRLCTLWEELQIYQPLPVCSYGAGQEIAKERDEKKIHQFLMGLDDARFGGLCTTLIGMGPLPSLGQIYSKVIREEQRLASARVREQEQEAVGFVARRDTVSRVDVNTGRSDFNNATRSDSTILKPRDRNTLCTHCGRHGHDKKDCWQIVGFPEWWTERLDRSGGGRGSSSRGRSGRGSGFNNYGRGRGQLVTAHATSSNSSFFQNSQPINGRFSHR